MKLAHFLTFPMPSAFVLVLLLVSLNEKFQLPCVQLACLSNVRTAAFLLGSDSRRARITILQKFSADVVESAPASGRRGSFGHLCVSQFFPCQIGYKGTSLDLNLGGCFDILSASGFLPVPQLRITVCV